MCRYVAYKHNLYLNNKMDQFYDLIINCMTYNFCLWITIHLFIQLKCFKNSVSYFEDLRRDVRCIKEFCFLLEHLFWWSFSNKTKKWCNIQCITSLFVCTLCNCLKTVSIFLKSITWLSGSHIHWQSDPLTRTHLASHDCLTGKYCPGKYFLHQR